MDWTLGGIISSILDGIKECAVGLGISQEAVVAGALVLFVLNDKRRIQNRGIEGEDEIYNAPEKKLPNNLNIYKKVGRLDSGTECIVCYNNRSILYISEICECKRTFLCRKCLLQMEFCPSCRLEFGYE